MAEIANGSQPTSHVCLTEKERVGRLEDSKIPPCPPLSNPPFVFPDPLTKGYSCAEIAKVQGLLNQTVAIDGVLKEDGKGGPKTEDAMNRFARLYNIDHPKTQIDPKNKDQFIKELSEAVARGAYKPKAAQ